MASKWLLPLSVLSSVSQIRLQTFCLSAQQVIIIGGYQYGAQMGYLIGNDAI